MSDAVAGDEVAGEDPAESAGATGDQDGSVGVEGAACGVPAGGVLQARGVQSAVAQRELGVGGGSGGVRRTGQEAGSGAGVRGGVDVEVGEPAGVFVLRGADEAGQGRGGQVVDVLVGGEGRGAAGEDDDAGGVEGAVAEQLLQGRQGVPERRVNL
nr:MULTISPECIES: hypothetical protein [unclassified Streptomyces]